MHNSHFDDSRSEQESQAKDEQHLVVEQIDALIENLTTTTKELCYDGKLEYWEGVDTLDKCINRGKSCLVIGDEGGGKACAAALCEDGQHKDLINIPHPTDIDSIYYELWFGVGRLLPHDNWNQTKRYDWDVLNSTCGECERGCPLKKPKGCFGLWPEPDQAKEALSQVTGKCLLMRYIVLSNLQKLKDNIIMVRIPDVNNDLIKLLTQILDNTSVIILCNPEQNQLLRKYNRFRQLPSFIFPVPPPDLFPKILQSKMEEVGMNMSAFDHEACNIMAVLSKFNFGRFNALAVQILNQIELDGEREKIDIGYILNLVAGSLDNKTMALIILYKYKDWMSAEDLSRAIKKAFKVSIPVKSLGWALKDLYEEKKIDRRKIGNVGKQYKIREQAVPLLEAGNIGTIEALPEGGDD